MWNKIKKEYVVIFIIFLSSMILFNYFDQEFNYTGQVYREINKNDITGYGVFDTIGNFFKNLFNKKEVGNIADRCVIYQNAIECFDSPYSCKWSPITRCRSSTSSQDEISCSAYNTLDRGICGSQCVSGCNNNANCVIRSITDSGTSTIRNVCITKNQISTTSTTNPTISSTTTTLQETNFIGAFDSVDCRYGIAGWVADRDNPSDSIEVDIIVDDVYFTTFDTSENERRDVCNELGNSYKTEGNTCKHGFFFNVPDELKDGREHSIDITGPYDSKIISYSRDSSNFIDKKILKCENTELQTSLQNPGLENGLNNWEQHDPSRPCVVNAQYFNSGSKSAKCDKEFTGLAQEIKLNTHTDYAYSIFIKNIGTKYGYACLFGKNFFDNTGAAACMGKTKVSPGEWKEVSYRFNSGNKSSTDDLHWELCEGACEQGQDLSGAAFLFDDYNIEEKEEVQNSCSNSCISNDFTLGKCAAPGSVQSMLNRGKTYNEGTCSYKYSELDGPTECGLNNNVCVCYNQDICPSSQCTVDGCTDRLNIVSDPPINVKADEELVYEPIIEGKITGHDLGYELVQGPSGATYITNKLRWTPSEDDAQSRIAFIIAVSDLTDSRNVRQEFSVEVLPGETIGSDLYAPSLESVDYNNDDGDVQLIWKDSGNGVTNDDTQGLIFSGLTYNPTSPKSTDRITFTATISGTATISEIKIYVDDSTVKTCSTSPCSSSLIGPFGAGAHTYKAVARDSSGNVYNSEVKSFTVTVPSPTTTVVSGCEQFTDPSDDEACLEYLSPPQRCDWDSNRNPPCFTLGTGFGTGNAIVSNIKLTGWAISNDGFFTKIKNFFLKLFGKKNVGIYTGPEINYIIERREYADNNWVNVDEVSNSDVCTDSICSFTDNTIVFNEGDTYFYRIKATRETEIGPYSNELSVDIPYDVQNENRNPMITSIPKTVAILNQEYQYDVDAADLDMDTLSYSLINIATGMNIDSSTGLIRWIPTQKGVYPVNIKVSDNKGGISYSDFELLVAGTGNLPSTGVNVRFEYLPDVDLTSDSSVNGLNNAHTLHIIADKDNAIKLISSSFESSNIINNVTTRELWIVNRLGSHVFYKNNFNKKTYAGKISKDEFMKVGDSKGIVAINQNVGGSYYDHEFNIGNNLFIEGKTITLIDVGSNDDIIVSVSGVRDVVLNNVEKLINGVHIFNQLPNYDADKSMRTAEIGVQLEKTRAQDTDIYRLLTENDETVALTVGKNSNGDYASIGYTPAQEENNEVIYGYRVGDEFALIGAFNGNILGKNISVANPRANGANDAVVLNIPWENVIQNLKKETDVTNGCNNGQDDDDDGVIDELDTDCSGTGAYAYINEMTVSNNEPYYYSNIEVRCGFGYNGTTTSNVHKSNCIKAKLGNNECRNIKYDRTTVSEIFECSTGSRAGMQDAVCYINNNCVSIGVNQNTEETESIEVMEFNYCSDGKAADDIKQLEFKNVNVDQIFEAGKSVNVKIRLKNDELNEEDLKIGAAAGVIDLNDGSVLVEDTDSANVKFGKTQEYSINLEVPRSFDSKHIYRLFIKGYNFDDESNSCVQNSIAIKMKGGSSTGGTVTTTTEPIIETTTTTFPDVTRPTFDDNFPRDTLPDNNDIDNDELPDDWELKYFDSLNEEPDADYDQDGRTNLEEYEDGTDPTDAKDVLKKGISWYVWVIIIVVIIIIIVVAIFMRGGGNKYSPLGKPSFKGEIPNFKFKDESIGGGFSAAKNISQLKDYVKKSKDKGFTDLQIKKALLAKGWTQKEVDDAFK